jgi:hypothetical protein
VLQVNRSCLKGIEMNGENQAGIILDSLLFPKIFRSFRMAIQPSKLIIAFCSIAMTGLVGWLMDLSTTVITTPGTNGAETELNLYLVAPDKVDSYIERNATTEHPRGVFSTMWGFGISKFHGSLRAIFRFDLFGILDNIEEYLHATKWAIWYHPTYCAIFALINLCIVSVGGGAICRIAALQLAQNEKPGVIESLRFSIKRFTSFFATPLVPAIIIAIAGLCVVSIGLISNIPFGLGELGVGILMLPALVAGAVIAAVLLGAIGGLNLTFPAVAYNGSDSLDAVSRSFNYVYAKPWRLGFYTAIAVIYGAICYIFVRFFAFLLLWSTYRGLRFGAVTESARGLRDKVAAIWPEPAFSRLLDYSNATGTWQESTAALLVYLSALVIVGLVASFIISFYFSSNTVIYALMRNQVDETPIEEVYTETAESKGQPSEAK